LLVQALRLSIMFEEALCMASGLSCSHKGEALPSSEDGGGGGGELLEATLRSSTGDGAGRVVGLCGATGAEEKSSGSDGIRCPSIVN
jgi:hypothetical protein